MAHNKTDKDISLKDRAINAALASAAEQPWQHVTFEDILERAGIDRTEALEYFDDKADILAAYGRLIDKQMLENIGNLDGLGHRESIFDLLMERFDIVNKNREAIISILTSFKAEPKNALETLPHLSRSMSRVLEAAGIETDGIIGCARITAITGIYLYALKTWMSDDSPDLAKTMATLDKTLEKAEMLYNSLPFWKVWDEIE